MLRKKTLLQSLMIAGSMSIYAAMLGYQIITIREFAVIITVIIITVGVATAYVEYHRRKLFAKFSRYTDSKLGEQARRFRGELLKTMQERDWSNDSLDALLDLAGEFLKIRPLDKSRHQLPEQVENNS